MSTQVKMLFEIPSDDSDSVEIESMWVTPCEKGYMIDNIPFYAKGVAYKDVMSTKKIDDDLYADKLLSASHHSTVRIWFVNEKLVASARQELKTMGCGSEISDSPRLVAVDIPPNIEYGLIKKYLDDGELSGKWDYEEACLDF